MKKILLIILISFCYLSQVEALRMMDTTQYKLDKKSGIVTFMICENSCSCKSRKEHKMYKVDIPTFKSIRNTYYCGTIYAKDKNNVYYRDNILKNVDPKNFRKLFLWYMTDGVHVFYNGKILSNESFSNFKRINSSSDLGDHLSNYVTDGVHVFYKGKIIALLKDGFTVLYDRYGIDIKNHNKSNDYGKDNEFIYFGGRRYSAEGFKDLGIYKINKDYVFKNGKPFKNLDSKTFQVMKSVKNLTRDKNGIYVCDVKVPVDVKSFQYVAERVIKDKNNIYKLSESCVEEIILYKVKNVDIKTFKYNIINQKFFDKNGVINISHNLKAMVKIDSKHGNTVGFRSSGIDYSGKIMKLKREAYIQDLEKSNSDSWYTKIINFCLKILYWPIKLFSFDF